MRRRLFTTLSVLSLAMCIFALTVWLLSFFSFAPIGQYWTTSWDGNGSGWAGHGWIAVNGSLHLLRDERNVAPAPTSVAAHYRHSGIDPLPGVQPQRTHWGFARVDRVSAWRERETGRRVMDTTQQISFPGWLPSLLFAIVPALWLWGAMRRRRLRSAGLCLACGYNLTGNTSGVCPECGKPATVAGVKA
jgi:hypothetical protein